MPTAFKTFLSLFKSDNRQTIADKEDYYPYIDGLRGVAILLVLLVHCVYEEKGVSMYFVFSFTKEFVVEYGQRGVHLFFLVSAFTLFSSSRRRYSTDKHPRASFYTRRLFRIYPPLAVAIIATQWGQPASVIAAKVIATSLFLPCLSYSLFWLSGLSTAWSIMCEETFYFLMPFIYSEITSIYGAVKFFIATCLLSAAWNILAPFFGIQDVSYFLFRHPFNNWFLFAGGILIYFFVKHPFFKAHMLDSSRYHAALALFTVFVLASAHAHFYAQCLGLMLLFAASVPEEGLFSRIMRNKIIMRFGAYCYSIYLFHRLVLSFITPFKDALFSWLGISLAPAEIQLLVFFPMAAAACLLSAYFTFNFLEKPCVRLGRLCIPVIDNWLDRRHARGN